MPPKESAGIRRWSRGLGILAGEKDPGIQATDGIQLWLHVGTAWNSKQEFGHVGASVGETPGSFGFSVAGPSQLPLPGFSSRSRTFPDPGGTRSHPCASHPVSRSSRTFLCQSFPKVIPFLLCQGSRKTGIIGNVAQKWELPGIRLILRIFSSVQLTPLEPWISGILGAHQHSQRQEAVLDSSSIPESPGFPGGS